jgi:hypothetical protein
MFEEDAQVLAHPRRAVKTLRSLGVDVVRPNVQWASIAPDPASHKPPTPFNASDPTAYPQRNWTQFDRAAEAASADGVVLDMLLTGAAPLWATGSRAPPAERSSGFWDPSPTAYGQFVQAVAARYSGTYTPLGASAPLPKVRFWELWSEPNWGPSLAPQLALDPVRIVAAREYRDNVDAGWSALPRTGYASDAVVIGSLSPRGVNVAPQIPRSPRPWRSQARWRSRALCTASTRPTVRFAATRQRLSAARPRTPAPAGFVKHTRGC